MSETYATYRVWDGCKAPNNLESGARLVGQRVSSVSVDRDALLNLADEMQGHADAEDYGGDGRINAGCLWSYADHIREALGVES